NGVPPSRIDELGSDPKFQVLQLPAAHSQYVVLQHKAEPLDDVNARMALNYATDKQAIVQAVLFGHGFEATTFMPKGALFWNDELPGFPFNVDTAKQYLAKSKAPNGFKIEFQYKSGDAAIEQVAAAIKDMWSKINVDVAIAPTEESLFNQNFNNESFQAY